MRCINWYKIRIWNFLSHFFYSLKNSRQGKDNNWWKSSDNRSMIITIWKARANSCAPQSIGSLGISHTEVILFTVELFKSLKFFHWFYLFFFVLKPPPKKWKNVRYKKWDPSFSQELQPRPETPKSEVEVVSIIVTYVI